MRQLRVYLTGPFRAELCSGADVTPVGSKEQALIALLLASPTGGRTRGWLQAHLWSDRQRKQAADSLRQADYRIRKALGTAADVMSSSKQAIHIAQDAVEIVETSGGEYLEGLDIRDEAFNQWLMEERSAREYGSQALDTTLDPDRILASVVPQRGPSDPLADTSIFLRQRSEPGTAYWWPERVAADAVIRALNEEYAVKVLEVPRPEQSEAWRIEIDGFEPTPGMVGVRVSLTDCSTGAMVWAKSLLSPQSTTANAERPEIHQLVQELCQSLCDRILSNDGNTAQNDEPDWLCQRAIRLLFTMQPESVAEADRLFDRCYAIHPRGLYLAWKAQLREIQILERISADPEGLQEEVRELVHRAMMMEPSNAMLLALVANAKLYVEQDIYASLDFARRSVHLNPGNAMGRWALSSAQLFSHDATESYRNAKAASFLTEGTPMSFWAKSQQGGAAIALGRLDEAKTLFRSAVAGCPNFRPALRYLFAIYACSEEWDLAVETAGRLREVEPDFSIERMAMDKDYPVALLRATMDMSRVLSLA